MHSIKEANIFELEVTGDDLHLPVCAECGLNVEKRYFPQLPVLCSYKQSLPIKHFP